MIKRAVDHKIHLSLRESIVKLEEHFDADVLVYYGNFINSIEDDFLKVVEDLVTNSKSKKDNTIYIILTTSGGDVLVVERLVNILRHHYKQVNFIIPNYAYSAGTVFCMSGDSILMDYFSVLGPIDPQVLNKDGKWVAALGYLDKIEELLKKSKDGTMTQAEFLILKNFDLAELRSYEQAKNLTIDLLEKWLVKYKFKNWTKHRTDKEKKDKKVTENEKEDRAKEIAEALGNHNTWKSHGRPLNIEAIKDLRLEIDDYSDNLERRKLIRDLYELVKDWREINNYRNIFIATREIHS